MGYVNAQVQKKHFGTWSLGDMQERRLGTCKDNAWRTVGVSFGFRVGGFWRLLAQGPCYSWDGHIHKGHLEETREYEDGGGGPFYNRGEGRWGRGPGGSATLGM